MDRNDAMDAMLNIINQTPLCKHETFAYIVTRDTLVLLGINSAKAEHLAATHCGSARMRLDSCLEHV